MAFSPVYVDPNNIDAFPGPWQHWNLNGTGTTRYLFAYANAGFSLYRSTDSGATWPAAIDVGNFPGTISDNAILQTQLIVGGGTGGADLIRTASASDHSGTKLIEFCEFDLGTLTWSAITHIGGGFDQNTHDSLGGTECAGVVRFKRSDGTTIVIYQCETFPIATYGSDTGIRQVRVLKLSGATWTQLATFGTGVYTGPVGASSSFDLESNHRVLWTAVLDGFENVHVFMNAAFVPVPQGGSFYTTTDLIHVSVAAANDAVSAEHTVDTDLEQMPAATNPAQPTASTENGKAAVNALSTEIAFGYGYQTNTFPAGPGAALHVARGDMSVTPLNPTWTVATIASGEPIWNNGFANDVSVTYDATGKIALEQFGSGVVSVGYGNDTHASANLKVYWATEGAAGKGKLRFSELVSGTWAAAAQLWPDPDSAAVSLDGFSLYSDPPGIPVVTVTATNPGQGARKPVPLPVNGFDFCLHREYRLYCSINVAMLTCGSIPACFSVDERDWGVDG